MNMRTKKKPSKKVLLARYFFGELVLEDLLAGNKLESVRLSSHDLPATTSIKKKGKLLVWMNQVLSSREESAEFRIPLNSKVKRINGREVEIVTKGTPVTTMSLHETITLTLEKAPGLEDAE